MIPLSAVVFEPQGRLDSTVVESHFDNAIFGNFDR